MFWIKSVVLVLVVSVLSSGCSHRFKKSAYFSKSRNHTQKNHFNPRFADKSKKVRLDDEGILTGNQPQAQTNSISQATKKHPTMRSYSINGVKYYPSVVEVGTIFNGIASWYGPDFNGKATSNGEVYDMYAFTAAHKTLPMHTVVRITNVENMRQVTVRVNDRGPFVKGRIIDLSKAAARTIDMTKKGTARVRLEILGFNDGQNSPVRQTQQNVGVVKEHRASQGEVYVQIGSFALIEGAQTYQERFTSLAENYKAIIKEKNVRDNTVFKVLISGFKSDAEARNYIATHHGFENAFIIRD